MLATPEIIQEHAQLSRLEKLLPEWQLLPLYHEAVSRRADTDIQTAFKGFPFIGKRELRAGFPILRPGQNLERLLEQEVVELEHTSGTSGEQLPVLFQRGWWD